MSFRIPGNLKAAFEATFKGQNKSVVITQLMCIAVAREQRRQRHRAAVGRILAGRGDAPLVRLEQFEAAREEARTLGHIARLPDFNPSQAE